MISSALPWKYYINLISSRENEEKIERDEN
jgi:hypothetical protein